MLRLTPVDILNKRFSRRISGYHANETDDFLRRIAGDMEAILLENIALREQWASVERELTRYRLLENTLQDALVLGQQAADDIRDSARAQAAAHIESAHQRLNGLHQDTERLRLERRRLAQEMRALLESQMAWLDYEMAREAESRGAQTIPMPEPEQAVVALRDSKSEAGIENGLKAAENKETGAADSRQTIKISAGVSQSEYAALNELAEELKEQSAERIAPRNGAAVAVPSEKA